MFRDQGFKRLQGPKPACLHAVNPNSGFSALLRDGHFFELERMARGFELISDSWPVLFVSFPVEGNLFLKAPCESVKAGSGKKG